MLKTLATATLLTASSLADDSVNAGDISVETMGASGTFALTKHNSSWS